MKDLPELEKKTIGAWVIHHGMKLQKVAIQSNDYDQLGFAAKCGLLLNGLGGSDQIKISQEKARIIAGLSGINSRSELPAILQELKMKGFIDYNSNEIEIIGITCGASLEHTATIFSGTAPTDLERAAIIGAEMATDEPQNQKQFSEKISDTLKISKERINSALDVFSDVGFVDVEEYADGEKVVFNGNLFRRDNVRRASGILAQMTADENRKTTALLSELEAKGCLPLQDAIKIAGNDTLQKILSIGLIDENRIENDLGSHSFVTRASVFNKYGSEEVEDAFDLAKAFVASLTYGIQQSHDGRGRIRMLEALMRKMINGGVVGPATAIGQDYKVLEAKRVVQVISEKNGLYSMRLLKKDVGELALKVIQQGEASSTMMERIPTISAVSYEGPETNRMLTRKRQPEKSKKSIARMIEGLRTGVVR